MAKKSKQVTTFPIREYYQYYIPDEDDNQMCRVNMRRYDSGELEITHVHTNRAEQGKGMATAVMNKVLARWGNEEIWLQANPFLGEPKNLSELQAWYAKFGFEPVEGLGIPGIMRRKADGHTDPN